MSSKHSRPTRQSEPLRLSTNRSVVAVVVFTESRFTCFPGCQTQTTIQSHQNPNEKSFLVRQSNQLDRFLLYFFL
uniref:Uncharacterized protein n=1 Tax=Cannabis sativa TaxID=3483 RepID=A0A803R7N0_CANSA